MTKEVFRTMPGEPGAPTIADLFKACDQKLKQPNNRLYSFAVYLRQSKEPINGTDWKIAKLQPDEVMRLMAWLMFIHGQAGTAPGIASLHVCTCIMAMILSELLEPGCIPGHKLH